MASTKKPAKRKRSVRRAAVLAKLDRDPDKRAKQLRTGTHAGGRVRLV